MADKYIRFQVEDTTEILNIRLSEFSKDGVASVWSSQHYSIDNYGLDYFSILGIRRGKKLYLLDGDEPTENYIYPMPWHDETGEVSPYNFFGEYAVSNIRNHFGITEDTQWNENEAVNCETFLNNNVLRLIIGSYKDGELFTSTRVLLKYNYYNTQHTEGIDPPEYYNNMGVGCSFWYEETHNVLVVGGHYFFSNRYEGIFEQTYTNQYATPPFVVNGSVNSTREGNFPSYYYASDFGRALNGAVGYPSQMVYEVIRTNDLAINHDPLRGLQGVENATMYFMGTVSPNSSEDEDFPWKPSEEEPNKGTGLEDGDEINPDPLRQISMMGMVNIWRITPQQSKALHDYLWDDSLISNIGSFIGENPKQAILGFNYLPFSATGTTKNIEIGNVQTDIGAVAVENLFHEIDCGTVEISNVYGNFLDRNPYVNIMLYLPYIGMVSLDPDLCVGKTISVKFRIDVLSGGIVAYAHNGEILIDTWSGNCATQIPWSTEDKAQMIKNTIASAVGGLSDVAMGNVGGGAQELGNMLGSATTVWLDKFRPQAHGGYSGNTGALLNYKPYILVYRAKPNIAQSYGAEFGFCSNVTKRIGSCSGFTVVSECKLNFSCTNEEKDLIYNELRSGIII